MLQFGDHLKQALLSLRLSPYASGITILTVAASFLLTSGLWLIGKSLEAGLTKATSQAQMTLYLSPSEESWEGEGEGNPAASDTSANPAIPKDSAESGALNSVENAADTAAAHPSEPEDLESRAKLPLRTRELLNQVEKAAGLGARAEFVSAKAALNSLYLSLGTMGAALETLSENPLPASIELHLPLSRERSLDDLQAISAELASLPGVNEVDYGHDVLAVIDTLLRQLRRAGLLAFAGALGLALFLTVNVIRLSVYSRREEIEILRLVGASDLFTALPFLLEGALVGLLGGFLAAVGTQILHTQVFASQHEFFALLNGLHPPAPSFLQLLTMVLSAAGIGILASLFAVIRFLRRVR